MRQTFADHSKNLENLGTYIYVFAYPKQIFWIINNLKNNNKVRFKINLEFKYAIL